MNEKSIGELFLETTIFRFENIKGLGERAMAQLEDKDLLWQSDEEANSIAIIVQHIYGNALSRWTDFLTTDGDKPTRDREGEFTQPETFDRQKLMQAWEQGWACMFNTLNQLTVDDLTKNVLIRGQSLSVVDAIQRQLSHYSYHIGQIVYLARQLKGETWNSLSIPRGKSQEYKPKKRD